MSLAAPRPARSWLPVIIAMTIGAFVGAGASVLTNLPTFETGSSGEAPPAASRLPQAAWVVSFAPLKGEALKGSAAEDELEDVGIVLQDVYDALWLDRSRLSQVIGARFAPSAASAMRTSTAGAPEGGQISIQSRRARIGIQIGGGRRAIAVVKVKALAHNDVSTVELKQRSTMWLEKKAGGWRVIAFDINQKRVNR